MLVIYVRRDSEHQKLKPACWAAAEEVDKGQPQGNDGPTGATGQPGEVSLSDLNAALLTNLNQCSNNSNSVGSLSMNADPAYDQNQMQAVMQKLDELINALRR